MDAAKTRCAGPDGIDRCTSLVSQQRHSWKSLNWIHFFVVHRETLEGFNITNLRVMKFRYSLVLFPWSIHHYRREKSSRRVNIYFDIHRDIVRHIRIRKQFSTTGPVADSLTAIPSTLGYQYPRRSDGGFPLKNGVDLRPNACGALISSSANVLSLLFKE